MCDCFRLCFETSGGIPPASSLFSRIQSVNGGTKPHNFLCFGAMYVTKPFKISWFGALDVTKPPKFVWFAGPEGAGVVARCSLPGGEPTHPNAWLTHADEASSYSMLCNRASGPKPGRPVYGPEELLRNME